MKLQVSFWLNLERALLQIQEMRDSPEVQLTLDILKHGKRFHATVSFDTDTGLKQSLAKVNDYSPLMKEMFALLLNCFCSIKAAAANMNAGDLANLLS